MRRFVTSAIAQPPTITFGLMLLRNVVAGNHIMYFSSALALGLSLCVALPVVCFMTSPDTQTINKQRSTFKHRVRM